MKRRSLPYLLITAFFLAFNACEKSDDLVPSETELEIQNRTSRKYAVLVDSEFIKNVESQRSCSFEVSNGTHRLECYCNNGAGLDTVLYFNAGSVKIVEFKTDNSGNCHVNIYDYRPKESPNDPGGKHPVEPLINP